MAVDAMPSPSSPTFHQDAFERAETLLAQNDRAGARTLLQEIITTNAAIAADDTDEIRAKEQAIYLLTSLHVASSDGPQLIALLTSVRGFFALLPKAKATRMVRKIFESVVVCGVSLDEQQRVCEETIQWARNEKRTFLRHRLQLRLAEVQYEKHDARTSLRTLVALLREVRRLDDRTLLLDVHLLESKVYYSIKNISKARAALVAARTTANSIYCPPLAQAEIDLQSGVLHAEERDYRTAFSYLFEAFEGFHQLGNQAQLARKALHYMVLAKMFSDNTDELNAVLSSKSVLEYAGEDMTTLRGIAKAYVDQDTHLFNEVLSQGAAAAAAAASTTTATTAATTTAAAAGASTSSSSGAVEVNPSSAAALFRDEVVGRQLKEMYDTLVERHLLRLIRPYSRVQTAYLSSLLRLDEEVVEGRISQLILDKKLSGIVDQQHACLIVFDDVDAASSRKQRDGEGEKVYENAADKAVVEAQEATTLHQDALVALERYDALVTALFDKVAGKFDSIVEDRLQKRQKEEEERKNRRKKGQEGSGSSGAKDGEGKSGGADDGKAKKDGDKDSTK